ncbi:hypothetical protein Cgig2_031699 [Carnegiea gigantea]|uniref:Uncharacterized protein n=1 Tax=Carnegiea gigantea TaxID=171969 RepID=A0A9Q1QPJ0_9CARY|nr:hypothetical protein Cgig2_031699 [Carnegiea gigantea]
MKNLVAVFFSVLISLSCVSAGFYRRQSLDPLNFILGNENLGPLKNGILGEAAPGPASDEPRIPLILAENRTKRPDILCRFKTYDGGWNISNKHYWASVGFTGASGFTLAVMWLVSFGVALIVHHCFTWTINLKWKGSKHSQKIRPILLIVFTCASTFLKHQGALVCPLAFGLETLLPDALTIFVCRVGCILLSVGQDKFHTEVLHTLNYVVNQSDYTAQMLRNVTDYLSLAKSVDVPQFTLPQSAMQDINELSARLSSGAETLTQKTNENSVKVRKVFNTIRLVLITVAVVMLVLGFVGLGACALSPTMPTCDPHIHFQRMDTCSYNIDSLWNFCHIQFVRELSFISRLRLIFAISDSCVAMQEWADNPQAETALSNILPCVDERATNQTLFQSRSVVRSLVDYINTFIYTEANTDRPPSDQFYYNQSGPLMPPLCYPFDDKMQDRECSSQEVSMMNASVVWAKYICTTSSDQKNCTNRGRLTPYLYGQLVLAVNASYAVLHYTPAMLNLQNCNFVRDTFVTITSRFCPPLEHYLHVVEIGLGLISAGIALCLILWLAYANRAQREEVFVKPSSTKDSSNIQGGDHGNTKDGVVNMVNHVVTSPARVVPHIVIMPEKPRWAKRHLELEG